MSELKEGTPVSPDLAALRSEALVDERAELQSAAPAAPPPTAAAPAGAPDPVAAELGGAVQAPTQTETVEEFRETLDYALDEWIIPDHPRLKDVYTEERRERLAATTHALFKKRGWSLGGLWLNWKEEIALLMVGLPILRDTRRALDAEKPAARTVDGEVVAAAPATAAPADGALKPNRGGG